MSFEEAVSSFGLVFCCFPGFSCFLFFVFFFSVAYAVVCGVCCAVYAICCLALCCSSGHAVLYAIAGIIAHGVHYSFLYTTHHTREHILC